MHRKQLYRVEMRLHGTRTWRHVCSTADPAFAERQATYWATRKQRRTSRGKRGVVCELPHTRVVRE